MEDLSLIVGLGNPGAAYARTRHNAGFMAVERLAARWGRDWEVARAFRARLCRAASGARRVLLCEPQTYMNLSGEAVARIAGYYQVPASRTLVIVDDADLALGQLRLRGAGSSGGHHGLESIERSLGTRAYARLRIGIGRAAAAEREITARVLAEFDSSEWDLMDRALDRAADQAACWLNEGLQAAMNRYNGLLTLPASEKDEER